MFVQVVTKPVADLDVFMGKPWANMGSLMGNFLTINNFSDDVLSSRVHLTHSATIVLNFRFSLMHET
jgi:hypothetical protein